MQEINLGRVKGATFTPAVDTEGNLSWTNDAGLVNPDPVKLGSGGGGVGKSEGDGTGEIFNSYDGVNKNTATGKFAHAEGEGTSALGDYSHVEGKGEIKEFNGLTILNVDYSTDLSIAYNQELQNIASQGSYLIFGTHRSDGLEWNIVTNSYDTMLDDGTSVTHINLQYPISDQPGSILNLTIRTGAAMGISSHAGAGGAAVGEGSFAHGTGSIAVDYNSITFGGLSYGDNSIAIGNRAATYLPDSIAIGPHSSAAGIYSTAIGYMAQTDSEYQVSLQGTYTNHLVNEPDDAINFKVGDGQGSFNTLCQSRKGEIWIKGLNGYDGQNEMTSTNTLQNMLSRFDTELTGVTALANEINGVEI